MYKVEAIIRNSALYEVKKALIEADILTFSIYQVQITGIPDGHQGRKINQNNYFPKSKIEIICSDKNEEKVTSVIKKSAATNEEGDGIVFSYKIDKFAKIDDENGGSNNTNK